MFGTPRFFLSRQLKPHAGDKSHVISPHGRDATPKDSFSVKQKSFTQLSYLRLVKSYIKGMITGWQLKTYTDKITYVLSGAWGAREEPLHGYLKASVSANKVTVMC